MGGHSSKISTDVTSNFLASATLETTKSCEATSSQGNSTVISGNDNVVDGVTQINSKTLNMNCYQNAIQSTDQESAMTTTIQNSVKDKSIALLGSLDKSKADLEATINNNVQLLTSQKVLQSCVISTAQNNSLEVYGDRNIVKNFTQTITTDALANCMQGSDQAAKAISSITNAANQSEEHTEENPLAFIGDALNAASKNLMIIAAIAFIALICFLYIMKSMSTPPEEGAASAPPMVPPMMPAMPQVMLPARI